MQNLQKQRARAIEARRERATVKYELFASHFVATMRPADAAIAAGYSKRTAPAAASRLLKMPTVQARIAELQKEVLARNALTADDVIKQLAAIIRFDFRKLFDENGNIKDISELDDDTASALSSIEIETDTEGKKVIGLTKKVKIFDKNAAITNGLKYFKLIGDDKGVNINAGTVIFAKELQTLL